ncbi:efflux RND transporter periplasmic adaptor subunit [Pinisolibacter aquiterrae]|uniref:efflux RND transporter periplasmic adaptor subunit n=1 Tax=Pinisolibacter aquiterrae TaxID=2815579 RepID=UPI001C3C51C6|nr:efflux RND transporter periplasmic adaptor subunit [Pinisolibacter aquiterrae]MCC8235613.1 efflux RND transporter periplasmic adaptor subunit [Pinisolibacter aquiterrae]
MNDTPQAPRRSPPKRLFLALLALAALAAAGYGAWIFVSGPEIRVVRPERGEVVRAVVATGRVLAPFRVDVGAQVTGVVEAVPVDEGQTVRRDQVLIRLENAEARAALAAAEAALAQATARVTQIAEVTLPVARETLLQAEASLAAAEAAFDRVDKLKTTGFATQAQVDDARKTRDVTRAQVRSARFQVETTDVGGTDRIMAEAALRQAAANVAAARTRLAYTVIDAPADGILIARDVEVGDVVQPGKALMTLSPTGETQIVVQIDEKNLALLAVGEKALVSADAYPNQRFAAELIYVNPSIDPQTASVQVKLKVADPPAWIRQDMTVSVDIEVARRTDALVLPTDAVHQPLSSDPWVLVAVDGHAVRLPVRVGLIGGGRTEIVSGLTASDAVVPVRTTIAAGDRLRAVIPPRGTGSDALAGTPAGGSGR